MCLKHEKNSLNVACYKVHILNLHFKYLFYYNIALIYVIGLSLHVLLKSLKQTFDTESVSTFHQFLNSA